MKNKRRLEAKLRGIESALDKLKREYDKGQIDPAGYLKLTVEYETQRAELEQALSETLDGVPPAHEVLPRPAEPVGRRISTSIWFAVGAVCLVAALAFAAALEWLPGASPATTATSISTPPPTQTPSPKAASTLSDTPTLSPGDTKTRSNDGMVMVYVPGGAFLMGGGQEDAQPVHSVTLDSFWLDRTEVSNAQYKQCVDAGECQAPTKCVWGEPTYEDAAKTNYPAACVGWSGAKAYCEWAGGRLPTEAEWEYAARGEQGFVYPWGNELDCTRGNFYGECDEYDETAPVGSFESGASWCGALDMAGNVWEWVDDWYDGYPGTSYQSDSFGAQYKVLRGGSWHRDPEEVRAAKRTNVTPDYRHYDVGLRCVVELGG